MAQGAKVEFREILKMFDFDPKAADEARDEEVLDAAARVNLKSATGGQI